ncbi:MAG: hypothetical protein ACI31C_06240 [Muribaculaceae bacterium]
MSKQEKTTEEKPLIIDLVVPQGWHELTQKQLRYVFTLIAAELSTDELLITCLFGWSGLKVVGKNPNRKYLIQKDRYLFEATPEHIAELLPLIGWLGELPTAPVRLERIGKASAIAADFQGVPFETYICVDNLYQGFLQTQNDALLDELARILYPKLGKHKLDDAERISVFYWLASLKAFFSNRFSDFLQPIAGASDGNLLGGSPNIGAQLQEAMDAQIRALTKGDITKEKEILSLDTWRALTELNAQAREYKQLQQQLKK